MIDWLNDNSGAVQALAAVVLVATLLVVLYQAVQTRKQADATELTVEEMREQRLSGDRPLLLVDLLDYKGNGKIPVGATAEECYPTSMSLRITNVGPGPAIEVEMTALHPNTHYWRSAPKGYLLKGESIEFGADTSIYPRRGEVSPSASNSADWELGPATVWGLLLDSRTLMDEYGSPGWDSTTTRM